ncbi:MAG TPA: hydroxymethylbilane synthase [Pyrinomonadaceae bacterium]
MRDELIIGSRGSKLALWQAEWVRARLAALSPRLDVRVEVVSTSGDVLKDAPLSVIGGQGAFTKELEHALLERRIDLAVHSLKDLPTVIPDRLTLAATPAREDARDALVLPAGTSGGGVVSVLDLPAGARVGTSSLRRRAQLRHLRPDLVLNDLRGNVDTRLRKLDAGEFDAIVLAAAGLRRLGLAGRISAHVSPDELLPAVGQGALGLEARADDEETLSLVARLDHAPTRAACEAERALLRQFGAGCQVPIAAHATVEGLFLKLEGLVAAPSGEDVLKASVVGFMGDAEGIGEELAHRLMARGAAFLLAGAATALAS